MSVAQVLACVFCGAFLAAGTEIAHGRGHATGPVFSLYMITMIIVGLTLAVLQVA